MEIPILKSSARITTRLNYLCPQLFPASGFWSLPHFNTSAAESSASEVCLNVISSLLSEVESYCLKY